MDRVYAEIPTGRGFAVRVTRSDFRGKPRVDVRHYFEARPGDPDTMAPTKKGASLPLELLPTLLDALRHAEADAIRDGALLAEDYENAGLPVPPALRGAA